MRAENRRGNPDGRFRAEYPAKVVATNHPNGLYKVQVRLMGHWDAIPEDDLPWAEFLLPLGCKPESGHQVPVEKDDLVWVDFPRGGDTRYPRITGSCYHAPDGKSHLPKLEQPGKGHADEPPAPGLSLEDDIYSRFGVMEYKTHSGVWGIVHIPTGTRVEINKEGVVVHAEGDSFRSSTKNTSENIGGDFKLLINGKANVEASEITFKSNGPISFEASKFSVISKGQFSVESKGNVSFESKGLFGVTAAAAPFKLG
ncbi:phage baseplate assembly protein V (plasmid) [Photobacterium sp. CCB-ST2H9]|uniref:phage baseplate assembly protein V n=1 Tax=Photobacterium sp. CCB-ST2H9 TaxID=2912855 RepID=UPI0020044AE3|nr:phage baseplate assembly protein V [Photobacterium sp. CCB-ST2H9]UTM60423.1 phage baseplate assembly protein V [Photobacterium sp. CCB-ST2H9]